MPQYWENIFTQSKLNWKNGYSFNTKLKLDSLDKLKIYLDEVHIKHCLVKPYFKIRNYPLVEARELLPSFDCDMFEHKNLPGFSLVAFERPLEYFSEIFLYDVLYPEAEVQKSENKAFYMSKNDKIINNIQTVLSRLPKPFQEIFKRKCKKVNISHLECYPQLLTSFLNIDRAQVLSLNAHGLFCLSGIFASFPSDINNELKRFGIRIGKFVYGDNENFIRNRNIVYQYLMELYGFPIVSERRTSAALFARKLHKIGEKFLLRVLAQTDRTITTYISNSNTSNYPNLEKIALIKVDADQHDIISTLKDKGFFLDPKNRVIIIRIKYKQHRYSNTNVRQDRALSVVSQEVIHPLTGEVLQDINIIKDTTNMILRLNDIVHGEFIGKITYKKTEIIENTDTDDKKLKFLYTWLTKHQRRIIGYSDDFFLNVDKVLGEYFYNPDNYDLFEVHKDLYKEVLTVYKYIQQARKVHILEGLRKKNYKNVRIAYLEMLYESSLLLNDLQFEIVDYFPELVNSIVESIEGILADKYLIKRYISPSEEIVSKYGIEVRKQYGRLVTLYDAFMAVRKSRINK